MCEYVGTKDSCSDVGRRVYQRKEREEYSKIECLGVGEGRLVE